MEMQQISARNLRSLLVMMVLCGSLISGTLTTAQDNWLSVLLIGVLFLPLLLIYSRIAALFPGKNLYDIIQILFGPVAGFLMIFFMTAYALLVNALQLRNFTEFTVVIALQDTPPVPIMLILFLPVFYLARAGVAVLGRWSIVVCSLILVNFALTLLLSLNIIDLSHVLPVMDHSLGEIASNAFTLGSIAVGETVIVMTILGNLKKGESPYKVYLGGVLTGVALFTLVLLRNILILGPDMEQAASFSTYMAVRVIGVGHFFERIESSISFTYILLGITKMALFLSAASMGIARLMRVSDHRRLLVPASLLVLAAGTVVFGNIFEMFDLAWASRYFVLPFQVLIPVIIWIAAERRKSSLVSQETAN
ncbi:MAG TPA: endospore germination permease [Pseudoflavonifractor sp.]|nr:endospore germination permease [Pseudoflavonifractor sp.]